jgi:hypothetical protein
MILLALSPAASAAAAAVLSAVGIAGGYGLGRLHAQRAAEAARANAAAAADATAVLLQERLDGAYAERNRVVAALATLAPALGWRAGRARTVIAGWDPAWHGCVYVDTPMGQLSWHFHESEAHRFAGLPAYAGTWDGHTTPEKYDRLAAAAARARAGA